MTKEERAYVEDSFFKNKENICTSNCPKCNAIALVRAKIGGCFGIESMEFAKHPYDENYAKYIKEYCKKQNISKDELAEIILGFLYSKSICKNKSHAIEILKKSFGDAMKFF